MIRKPGGEASFLLTSKCNYLKIHSANIRYATRSATDKASATSEIFHRLW